ncbi:two-component system, cell cycle sensor histidine kinase and response regulator CckA [Phycisphaerales bacterium]|nr:two-component system, cell cycle sensor histidine kinase and response regulator CckA [Phycisphaerales bacterium]
MGFSGTTWKGGHLHRVLLNRGSRSIRAWPLWAQFALAIGAVTLALLARLPLNPSLRDRVPFITLFLVMMPLVLLVRALPFLVASVLGLGGAMVLFSNRFLGGAESGAIEVSLFALSAVTATVTAFLAERQQQRQRSADAMLRAFVDDAPACKWVTNGLGQIVYANQAMADALGKTREQVIGRTHAELLPPRLAKIAVEHIRAVRESGKPGASFEEIEPLDGRGAGEGRGGRRVLEWRRFLLKMGHDDHVLVAGMANDITEKARIEQALRDSEARLRAVVEQLPVGVGVTDKTGKWVLTNATMDLYVPKAVPSTLPERAKRWRFWDEKGNIIPPENWPSQRALRGEAVVPGMEALYVHDDGREVWMRVSAAPLRNSAGDIVGATCVVLDIDLSKRFQVRLEEELTERTAEVRRAERAAAMTQRMAAVGTLASGLAHDINNITLPLGTRLDELLTNPETDEKIKGEMAVITALVDHLRAMSRNLSLFAHDPEKEGIIGATELASWCVTVQGLLESSLSGKGGRARPVRLKCDVPTGLPPVRISPHRLSQAVLNLVHNARDAVLKARGAGQMPDTAGAEAGCVTIEARPGEDGASVRLRVIDDGCGMDEETQRRATEPFFTTKDRPTAVGGPGSGMGLSLVHAVCERAGGTLDIQSKLGKGTTMTLTLPTVAEMGGEMRTRQESSDRRA